MSDETTHIFAILYVKPDKMDRFKELMSEMCKNVHGSEDYTKRYMATERVDGGGADICMFETYKDKDSADKHTKEQHFQDFFKKVQSEDLGRGPPYLATTKSFAGFDTDHKLL